MNVQQVMPTNKQLMPFGGGLGSFFGMGGFNRPQPAVYNPFDPGQYAKSLGMSREDRKQFVQDYRSGNLSGLFGSPMQDGSSMFNSDAPIETRVGNLEQAVQAQAQPPMQMGGMMPGYGSGIMPFANYGLAQPQVMRFG